MWNKEWKKGIDYPEWGNTEVYKKTIGGGYLYNGENPKQAYERVCQTVAKQLNHLCLMLLSSIVFYMILELRHMRIQL